MTYDDYMKKNLAELRKLAAAMGVKEVYSFRKAELVEQMMKCPVLLETLPEEQPAAPGKAQGKAAQSQNGSVHSAGRLDGRGELR